MARTKFTYEKRQRELAKKQKKEEKAARRAEAKRAKADGETATVDDGIDWDSAEPLPDTESETAEEVVR